MRGSTDGVDAHVDAAREVALALERVPDALLRRLDQLVEELGRHVLEILPAADVERPFDDLLSRAGASTVTSNAM